MVGFRDPIRRWELIALIAVLIAATALRLWRLDRVPPGLTHDEANNVHDAASILEGERPFYFPVAQGKEPLYPYSVALIMAIVGPTPLAMRLTSVFWGILLIPLTFVWTRRDFGPFVALCTVVGLAVSFWPISTSRLGLRAITLPVLLTGAVLAFPISESHRPGVIRSAAGGLCLGLTFYTYLAARVMPGLFLLFGVYLFLIHPKRWKRQRPHWCVVLFVTAAVAAPLFLYLRAHPSASIRIGQLDRPLRALLSGDPSPLLDRVVTSLQIFSVRGDGFVPYNVPGRPLFNPLLSVLFYGGLIVALWCPRDPACVFALLWLLVGFLPALVTGLDAANVRAVAAQPVAYVFPALALKALWDISSSHPKNRRLVLLGILASVVFAPVAFLTIRDYFVRWPDRRDVRVHYHTDLHAIANTVQEWETEEPVGVSAFYPGEYHDPRVVEALMAQSDPSLRWFDGRQALVLPSSSTARLILPEAIPLNDVLWAIVQPEANLLERVTLRPDDFNPSFAVYRWAPNRARDTLERTLSSPSQPNTLPVNVGGILKFQGYQLQGWSGKAGGEFTLLTLWHIDASLPDDRDAVVFAQLLNSQGHVIAQRDHLGAPSWNWYRGDAFVQLHDLSLPTDAPPGPYSLIAGVYTTPDRVDAVLAGREPDPSMPRLPVHEEQPPSDDAITLVTLEVK